MLEAVIVFLFTSVKAHSLAPQQQINLLNSLPVMCNLLTFLCESELGVSATLSLSGGNKLDELELLADDQVLSKLIPWLKGLFSLQLSF